MEFKLPAFTTVTAVFNIYLFLSICMVQVYATKKPVNNDKLRNESDQQNESENVMRTMRSNPQAKTLLSVNDIIEVARVEEIKDTLVNTQNQDQTTKSKISNRALDLYEEDEEYFRPSMRFDSSGRYPGNRIRTISRGNTERFGQRLRQPERKRLGDRRQTYLQDDDEEEEGPVRTRQRHRLRASSNIDTLVNEYETVYSRIPRPYSGEVRRPNGPPFRRQQSLYRQEAKDRFPYGRPPPNAPDLDLDQDYFNGVSEEEQKDPGLLDTIFALIKHKKPKRPELELNEPSIEWLYNDIDTEEKNSLFSSPETDLFIPSNSDYDDGNIDYRDHDDTEDQYVPEYNFKDVIHSIRNNESRIVTLKKFLSAASGLSDRAGSDPMFMLWSMPLTILSILGVFYAVSAIAVLGYKYVLLTTGNTNGQAVAVLPVVLLFTVPLVLSGVFLIARGALDGQINLGRLARGDLKHGLRQDFDSVDFVYDMGVGATALLGLGWVVSVTL